MNVSKIWNIALGLVFLASPAFGAIVGEKAPEFVPKKYAKTIQIKDENGKVRTLSEFKGKYLVLEWLNHGCPYVQKHYNEKHKNMQNLQAKLKGKIKNKKDLVWLSVVSSAQDQQGHMSPEETRTKKDDVGSNADAILLDPTGVMGKSYGARVTPHMFIIDPNGTLIYNGAIDDKASSDPNTLADAKNYVEIAHQESRIQGKSRVTEELTTPYGCGVKYSDEFKI